MRFIEFGKDRAKALLMFHCALEPWWAFEGAANACAEDYHVILSVADGHDESGSEVKPHMLESTCVLTWQMPWAALGSQTWSSADTRFP